ncbi:MAG: diacylglycerol kinase family protein [Eggerthellaceae bacterium]|nr:diacylglycerol kinase family protein [Eggerthellaceae bacterium]
MSRAPFIKSFGYAFSGIAQTFREGRNFKVQLGFAVAAIALGFAFRIEPHEWLAVILCMGCVLGGECVNTSIEAVVDLVSPDYHELAKRAKDCAAAGVLVCSIAAVIVEAIIILPKVFSLFS